MEIGHGSFGTVYKTRYQEEAVVVKQMQSMDHEFTKEFIKEAKLMLALEHQNVVKLKGICLNPKVLMMEFVCFDLNLLETSSKSTIFLIFFATLTPTTTAKALPI